MLSSCQDCRFYRPELCAVNPPYRERVDRWRGRLSEQDMQDRKAELLAWLNQYIDSGQIELYAQMIGLSPEEARTFLEGQS